MRSDVLLVACRDRRPRIECGGGVAARCTEPDTVHLVSAAATPLGSDAIHIRVVVEAGARLQVRTAAATVTLPGSATPESHAFGTFEVAGDLDVNPQATVVAATSRHFTSTRLELTGSGRVRLRERIQIGRSNERQGFWSSSLHADIRRVTPFAAPNRARQRIGGRRRARDADGVHQRVSLSRL
jgi:urease accessory protein